MSLRGMPGHVRDDENATESDSRSVNGSDMIIIWFNYTTPHSHPQLIWMGKTITLERSQTHHFGTQPFWHILEHKKLHHIRPQPIKQTSDLLTGAALWKPHAFQSDASIKKGPNEKCSLYVDVIKCHACHTKWRSMSPSATPATQHGRRCHKVPRLPHKQNVANPDSNNASTFEAFGGMGGWVRAHDSSLFRVLKCFYSCANPENTNGSTF